MSAVDKSRYPVTNEPRFEPAEMTVEEVGFAAAVEGRETEFPLLARAVRGMKPAHDVTVWWLPIPEPQQAGILRDPPIWRNECTIFRYPYGVPAEEGSSRAGLADADRREGQLTRMLAAVEQTLWDGVPSKTYASGMPLRYCGGVRHFLGRDPEDGDDIRLRPLRDLVWREYEYPSGAKEGEWLAEFSLQVTPHDARTS